MNVAYVRVSTIEQNPERQIKALESYKIDKWFSEKISGKNTDRPKLKEMLNFVREGDTVYVLDWSRLSRSASDLLKLIEKLASKNVRACLISRRVRIFEHILASTRQKSAGILSYGKDF